MKAVLERFEKAGSSEKLERPESWSGVNARTMEGWNNWKAGSTGKLEKSNRLGTTGMTRM